MTKNRNFRSMCKQDLAITRVLISKIQIDSVSEYNLNNEVSRQLLDFKNKRYSKNFCTNTTKLEKQGVQ